MSVPGLATEVGLPHGNSSDDDRMETGGKVRSGRGTEITRIYGQCGKCDYAAFMVDTVTSIVA
jgi:hypothetical protein